MKQLLFILFLHCALFAETKPITVRVLLTKLSQEAVIEVKGRYLLYNPKTETFLSSSSKKKKASIFAHDKGLYWGELLSNVFELRLVPDEKNCRILVNGNPYKGWIEIYNIGGTINIINEVDVENYLKASLGQKVPAKLSKETLEALAIIERTNLYHTIEKCAYASWQLDAQKESYLGRTQNRGVDEAVERTRALILHYNKKPFAATWGVDHAGRSVSYESIFRKEKTAPPGVDHLPSLNAKTKTKWKLSIPLQTLAKKTGEPTLTNIELFFAEKSKKVYALRLVGTKKNFDIDVKPVLKAYSLPSNEFTASLNGNKVDFIGYGKGLGTGLCLTSAEILAAGGASVEKILLTHFPQTKLINARQELGKRPSLNPAWQ